MRIPILVFLVSIAGCISPTPEDSQVQPTVSESPPPPPPAFSDRVRDELEVGMSREEVLDLFGPPHWVVLASDVGEVELASGVSFEFHYQNPGCNTIAVSFDDGRVTVWDEGRVCGKHAERQWPGDTYLCDQPERAIMCGLRVR